MSVPYSVPVEKVTVAPSAARFLQAAFTVCFGLILVGFVGFSNIEAVHNAAHDTRHANAFPCH
jgi:cobalt transporter subunit CbtB